MSFGATYGAISLNNVFNSALYRDIYEILLVRLRAPFLSQCTPQRLLYNTFRVYL
jgi:hypothetical protein